MVRGQVAIFLINQLRLHCDLTYSQNVADSGQDRVLSDILNLNKWDVLFGEIDFYHLDE